MSQKTLSSFLCVLICYALLVQTPRAYAEHAININTADKTTLTTLTGIGDVKAQAIIDYRTTNGSFATTEAIMNVSGIGTATFNGIKDHITVGSPTTQTQTQTTSTTPATPAVVAPQTSASGSGPLPITLGINAEERVMAGGGSYFSATAYGAEMLPLPGARFIWNFGDGVTEEGGRVFHTYTYPGRYVVVVSAAYNFSTGMKRFVVEAISASVVLEAVGDGSLLIRNLASEEVDIGHWSLFESGTTYVIPEHTMLLAGEGVRFATSITKLLGTPAALLRYPNGATAVTAIVSKNSPLRGERVLKNEEPTRPQTIIQSKIPRNNPSSSSETVGSVLGRDTASGSFDTNTPSFSPLTLSLVGLGVLLSVGVVGVHFLQGVRKETLPTADEFEIEG